MSVTLELPLIAITVCFLGYHERFRTPWRNGRDLAYSFLGGHLAIQNMISSIQMHIFFLTESICSSTQMGGVGLLSQ